LVFDRWNRILISIYATKEKMMMIWWGYSNNKKRVAISSYRHIFLDKKQGNKRKKKSTFFWCLVEKAEGLGRAFQHKTQSAHNYRYSICWWMIGKGQIDDGEKERERWRAHRSSLSSSYATPDTRCEYVIF
jgi:integrase